MQFENLKMFSFSGRGKTNDDSYGFSETSLWVVDGTCRSKNFNITKTKSDAQWFAKQWNNFFQLNVDSIDNLSMLISKGIDFINDNLTKLSCSTINKNILPLISFAIIKVTADYIIVHTVGDCDIILKSSEGLNILLTDEINLKHRNHIVDMMVNISKIKKINVVDARKHVKNILDHDIDNDLFNFFSHCKEDIGKISTYSFKLKDISKVCIMSDGVSRFYNTFRLGTYGDLINILDSDNFVQIHDILNDFQTKDIKCNLYPRLNPYNDMTVICANVQK